MALDHSDFEVLVVDNTSGDPAVRELAQRNGARYVVEPNGGLSRARNCGGRAALGSLVAFIDDDAVPDRAWLGHHARALEDAGLAATMGRILPAPADSPTAAAYHATGGEDLGEVPFQVDRSTPHWFELTNFGGLGVGPNMVFRRELFDARPVFPERLGPGAGLPGEEHYALFALVRDGHAVAYVPQAVVHHDAPATWAELERRKRRITHGSAAYLVMLALEERGYRGAALRYAAQAVRGRRRSWRPSNASVPLASRRELAAAAVAGPLLYLRSKLDRARR
jgi:cellulose synthase/poly-beta-1,6-N-acetylglucosamine synthase-like glycosyltransferase